jgi:serine/threonine protein kinase
LIDQNGNACLADFGLLTIASDSADPTASNSFVEGGTTQWMSPELLDPDQFGSKDNRPTKESDCYALGMVIYEVLSGRVPFAPYRSPTVIQKVTKGERPTRPEGVEGTWFTDDLWTMLTQCWVPQPKSRPGIEAVLACLEPCSRTWKPPPPQVDEDAAMGEDGLDLTSMSDFSSIISHFSRETKKALLIGISYHKGEKGCDPIPTSIPNAKKFATFLRGKRSLPPSILSRLRGPSAFSRALWVYGHCFNDRRGGSRQEISTNKEQFGLSPSPVLPWIHIR